VYTVDGKLELKEMSQPGFISDGAIIKIKASSICGTDLRSYRLESSGIKPPRIIGHNVSARRFLVISEGSKIIWGVMFCDQGGKSFTDNSAGSNRLSSQ